MKTKTEIVTLDHGGQSQRCLVRASERWAASGDVLYRYDRIAGHMVIARGLSDATIRRRLSECRYLMCYW